VVYEKYSWIIKIINVVVIRNLIMNNLMILSMFNHHVPLKMLVIAETKFTSTIIMLWRFKEIKRGLFNLVISEGQNI